MKGRKTCFECINYEVYNDIHESYFYCKVGAFGGIDHNIKKFDECSSFKANNSDIKYILKEITNPFAKASFHGSGNKVLISEEVANLIIKVLIKGDIDE